MEKSELMGKDELEKLISSIPRKNVHYEEPHKYEGYAATGYPVFSPFYYFIREFKRYPYTERFNNYTYEAIPILEKLIKKYPNMECIFYSDNDIVKFQKDIQFSFELKEGLYISMEIVLGKKNMPKMCYSYIVYGALFIDEIKDIKNIFNEYKIGKDINNTATVGIITTNNMGFKIRDFNIIKNIGEFNHLDLHYGQGFEEYYSNLKKLIKNNTKGLVIFHGNPGTGKTYCIKNLIKDLSQEDKRFLYVSADMVVNIMRPDFITFIMDYAQEDDMKNLVLIIEDAEPLLNSRDNGGGEGVSNILNLSDGILNDMLGFQVIATFNTERNLDTALLRSGRLLSKKRFTKIPTDRAKKLIDVLEIDMPITKQITLADIYSYKNTFEILQHETDEIDDEENNKYKL